MGASAAEEPSQMRRALVDTLAGAISGGISRTVTSPLDVIKIRFQVRQNPDSFSVPARPLLDWESAAANFVVGWLGLFGRILGLLLCSAGEDAVGGLSCLPRICARAVELRV
jgi:hypothetical protein